MITNDKITLSDQPLSTHWHKTRIGDDSILYVGQLNKNKQPDGLIFSIDSEGRIYQGFSNKRFERDGFGRFIFDGEYSIGWWKQFMLSGNARIVEKNGRIREGWFSKSKLVGDYRTDIREYIDFDDYLIKY